MSPILKRINATDSRNQTKEFRLKRKTVCDKTSPAKTCGLNTTGKEESLGTSDKAKAFRLLLAKNEADQQPAFNAQIARTYLAAGDPALPRRTRKEVMVAFVEARALRRQMLGFIDQGESPADLKT